MHKMILKKVNDHNSHDVPNLVPNEKHGLSFFVGSCSLIPVKFGSVYRAGPGPKWSRVIWTNYSKHFGLPLSIAAILGRSGD